MHRYYHLQLEFQRLLVHVGRRRTPRTAARLGHQLWRGLVAPWHCRCLLAISFGIGSSSGPCSHLLEMLRLPLSSSSSAMKKRCWSGWEDKTRSPNNVCSPGRRGEWQRCSRRHPLIGLALLLFIIVPMYVRLFILVVVGECVEIRVWSICIIFRQSRNELRAWPHLSLHGCGI
jgi:hypothetical protein